MKTASSLVLVSILLAVGNVQSTPAIAANSGGNCSYRQCIRHCFDTGAQFPVLGRRGGDSCQDICKHKACGDADFIFKNDP
jgi:hypothetical protein